MDSSQEILEKIPVGFRFQPTDEELVNHFLKLKLLGENSRVWSIGEIDICNYEPWDLPEHSVVKSDDPEWFFFSRRNLKYSNSNRSNRATKAGYWKATGKDRNIKKRGTNNVIGTKKTLVFYEGRVPHGVKTNWVIHEYHATSFPVGQRTYVLCRLMKKPETKTEEVTDGLVYNEGEPSSHMASDYENQATADQIPDVNSLEEVNLESAFLATPQAEVYDFDSVQQSPFVCEQELLFSNSLFGIPNDADQFLLDTTEEEDNAFLNAIIADEDVVYTEEKRHAFVTDSTPSGSLRKVYYESSDTEAEVISARSRTILDGPTACSQHAGSREYRVMKMVKSSHGAVHASSLFTSNQEVNREKKDSIHDDFWGVDTSSGDSTKDRDFYINCISTDSSPSPLRRDKPQYHPKSDNFVSQKASARRQTQRKVSSKEIFKNEVRKAQKETSIVQSNKDQRKTQGTSSRKNSETKSIQSSVVDRKGSCIYWETPSSQNLNPHSVYLVNVLVGFFLLIVTVWDLISSRS